MGARTNRRWLIARRPDGPVTESAFRWVEEPAPSPGEGQYLGRNLWFTFSPTQQFFLGRADVPGSGAVALGEVMAGPAVSQIVESRHPVFRPGDLVHGQMGWEDYTVADGTGFNPAYRIPAGTPPNWAAATLGITGLAAYFGVTEIARPKPGETFVVTGGAGGVGSIAIQLAKLRGLRTVGIAGGPAKCEWLRNEGGADGAIDYRREDVGGRLGELCPDGIDIFFDNEYGPTLDLALERLRPGGRVVMCGGSARYGAREPPPGPRNLLSLVMAGGRLEGFLARDYIPRFPEAAEAMLPLLRSGRLKQKEDVAVGLRSAPAALARLLAGANIGSQLLRMDDPPPT